MGNAKGSQKKKRKSTYISPKSLLYLNDECTPAYSTFYHFTRWITNFYFFNEIADDDEETRLVIMKDGPNDYNIYQIIKAIDQLESKNIINEFSFCEYFDMSEVDEEEGDDDNYNNEEGGRDGDNKKGIKSKLKELINHRKSVIPISRLSNKKANIMFLSQKDFKIKVYELIEIIYKQLRKKFNKLLIKGLPNNLRWFMWMCLASEKYKQVEDDTGISNYQLYTMILKNKLKDEIELDILRNLQSCVNHISYYYESDKVNHLYNLLRAIALYDKEIGYSRIINKIAAYILIISNFNEAEAFFMIRYMLSPYYGLGLREMILDNKPTMVLFNYIMRFFIEERMPNINELIQDYNIKNDSWLSSWVKTLFIDLMPFNVCIRIWDCLFVKEMPFFYNYILGLIKHYEPELLTAKSDIEFFNKFDVKLNHEEDVVLFREKIINLSEGITITQQMIHDVEEKYYNSSQRSAWIIPQENKQEKAKENKEMKVILKIIAQGQRNGFVVHEEKVIEYDPEVLSLDDLEVNKEGYLANKSSTGEDDDISSIEIQDEYINKVRDLDDIEYEYKNKNKEGKKNKNIKQIYTHKQKNINAFQGKAFQLNLAIKEEKKKNNNDSNKDYNGIMKDVNLSDLSIEVEEPK